MVINHPAGFMVSFNNSNYFKYPILMKMVRKQKDRLKDVLTVIGWIIIGFALFALIRFIINSGVF